MNNVILIGRLTKDPILKKTQSSISVTSFSLAVDRKMKKEGQQDADFINCVAWQKTADVICDYVKKGNRIGIRGRIETRKYDDQTGKTIYITEVIVEQLDLLEPKPKTQDSQIPIPIQYDLPPIPAFESNDTLDIDTDSLPF